MHTFQLQMKFFSFEVLSAILHAPGHFHGYSLSLSIEDSMCDPFTVKSTTSSKFHTSLFGCYAFHRDVVRYWLQQPTLEWEVVDQLSPSNWPALRQAWQGHHQVEAYTTGEWASLPLNPQLELQSSCLLLNGNNHMSLLRRTFQICRWNSCSVLYHRWRPQYSSREAWRSSLWTSGCDFACRVVALTYTCNRMASSTRSTLLSIGPSSRTLPVTDSSHE